MKVSKAEELVCPFIQKGVIGSSERPTNSNINCITSKCMAWDKKTEYSNIVRVKGFDGESISDLKKRKELGNEFSIIKRELKMLCEMITFGIKIEEETGYCKKVQ